MLQEGARSGATYTMVPVGWPVGEPPRGSMLTATWLESASACFCIKVNVRLDAPAAGRMPSDTGAAPYGSAQSS